MTARDTLEYLSNIGMSPHYMKPITLHKNLQFFPDFKIEFETTSNPMDIPPPSVWFTIDHNECLSKIKNDVEKSRVTRQGYLITNTMGNCLNQINYQSFQEDVGVIQQSQHCFCVPFSVVKDNCQQILKYIHKQLRVFHETSLTNKVKRSYMNTKYLDEISEYIYSKFRTFIIFQAKMQSTRVPILHSCYYPNVNFIIQKIKTKEGPKFAPNQTFNLIKEGGLRNSFGYLSLDIRKRFLMIRRDEPDMDFQRECFIGVWISSFLPLKRSQKKFGKDDAIWSAIYEFYTSKQLKNRIRLTEKNKAFLVYFPPSTPNKPKRLPQYYLFEADNKLAVPKWCFMLKQETLTDWKKNLQVKFDFLNNTIMEERQYSQFSDANNEDKSHNMHNGANSSYVSGVKDSISQLYLSNSRNLQNSYVQSKGSHHSSSGEEKQKNKIEQLEKELEYYKKRCLELETMNNMLLNQQQQFYAHQQYISNGIMPNHPMYPPIPHYSQPYQMMNPAFNYNNQVKQMQPQPIRNQGQKVLQKSSPQYCFAPVKEQQASFGMQKNIDQAEGDEPSNTMFMKKKSSTPPPNTPPLPNTPPMGNTPSLPNTKIKKESQIIKNNSESIRQIFVKPDARNISFQDSFAEYRQDDEDEVDETDLNYDEDEETDGQQDQKNKAYLQKDINNSSNKVKKTKSNHQQFSSTPHTNQEDDDMDYMRSPEFKRFDSLPTNQNRSPPSKTMPKYQGNHTNFKAQQDEDQADQHKVKQEKGREKNNSSFDFQQFLSKYNISKNQFQSSPKKTTHLSSDEEDKPYKHTSKVQKHKQSEKARQQKQQQLDNKQEVGEKVDSDDSDQDVQLKNILNKYKS